MTNGLGKSDSPAVCARQRCVQVGQSPTGAPMGSTISKGGGNASLASHDPYSDFLNPVWGQLLTERYAEFERVQ